MTYDPARLALLVAFAATSALSIFASQLLLALGFVALLGLAASGRVSYPRTAADVPILALVVWTLLSASFALEPVIAHEAAKKLVLFAALYVALAGTGSDDRRERVIAGFLLGGLALASLMVLEALFLGQADLENRPRGFLGHYMTASGIVMMALLVSAARLAFGERPRRPSPEDLLPAGIALLAAGGVALARSAELAPVPVVRIAVLAVAAAAVIVALRERSAAPLVTTLSILLVPVTAVALVVSQTRSAWLGAVAGLALVAILRSPRLLVLLGVGIVLLFIARPGAIRERLTVTDASSRDRYYMWQAGIDMILERPVFGQGPGMVEYNYDKYRWPEAPNARAPHLHNNIVQIAAERGLPALVLFSWWIGSILVTAFRELRSSRGTSPARAWPAAVALAVVASLVVAGLFEYNLGDSEIIMSAFILFALPYAVRSERLGSA